MKNNTLLHFQAAPSLQLSPWRQRAASAAWLVMTCIAGPALAETTGQATPAPFSKMAEGAVPAPWRFVNLPNKSATEFSIASLQGEHVLRVSTHDAYGNLVYPLRKNAAHAMQLGWRWRVDQLVEKADIQKKSGDDAALKLCVSFDFDPSRLRWSERASLRLAAVHSGEKVPAQTLCYIWDNQQPTGTLLSNAFTSRIRFIVLQSGSAHLGHWVSEQRDLAADYARAFGDESPQNMPDVLGLIVAADADNTHGTGLGYMGDIHLDQGKP